MRNVTVPVGRAVVAAVAAGSGSGIAGNGNPVAKRGEERIDNAG